MDESVKKEPASDPWKILRTFTHARIAIGRTGHSIPLSESLQFKLAHAHARDAVYSTLDTDALARQLLSFQLPVVKVHSKASSRQEYLQRPDLGRQLHLDAAETLRSVHSQEEVVIILADGLSARAVQDHAFTVLQSLVPSLHAAGIPVGALVIASQARVALGDAIGELLHSRLSLVLIGERPGLSSPDSLGAYLTYAPRTGLTDESRNCISNIRPEGLVPALAAEKIRYLLQESWQRKLSGIQLKDESGLLS